MINVQQKNLRFAQSLNTNYHELAMNFIVNFTF